MTSKSGSRPRSRAPARAPRRSPIRRLTTRHASRPRRSSRRTDGKKQTDAQLKKACKTEFDQLKKQVMQFLIQAQWVEQEAAKQDIKITDAQVQKSFADQKKQAFPTDKAYKKFLQTSGMTEQDILFRVRLDQLQQKLTQKVTEKETKVTDEDVSEYYDKNKKRFAQPERRDLLIVLTKTQGQGRAGQAGARGRPELEAGHQAVLDRRGFQGAGRQAARRGQGPAGEVARHRRLHGQEERHLRSREDPVRLVRLRGHARSRRPRSSRWSSPRRRSRTCSSRRSSSRRSTTSSRTSARTTRTRPSAPTITRSPSARTVRTRRPTRLRLPRPVATPPGPQPPQSSQPAPSTPQGEQPQQ